MQKLLKPQQLARRQKKIGLNSASKGTLRKLPKVGAIVAERIIEARPFSHLEQLKKVDGMTENLFLSLEHLISLD
jgi:DNA uptake protein ComE-like DNA-binding protein